MRKILVYKPESIKLIRTVLNLSATDIGKIIGVTRQTIRSLEIGRKTSKPILISVSLVLDWYIENSDIDDDLLNYISKQKISLDEL